MEITSTVNKFIKEIRDEQRWRYVILQVRNRTIEVIRTGNPAATFNNFTASMQHTNNEYKECRIGLFNMEYKKAYEGSDQYINHQRVILVLLDSLTAPSRVRSQYFRAFGTLKAYMPGVEFFEGTEVQEISVPVILDRLRKLD
jgi:hypothetical protein